MNVGLRGEYVGAPPMTRPLEAPDGEPRVREGEPPTPAAPRVRGEPLTAEEPDEPMPRGEPIVLGELTPPARGALNTGEPPEKLERAAGGEATVGAGRTAGAERWLMNDRLAEALALLELLTAGEPPPPRARSAPNTPGAPRAMTAANAQQPDLNG